MKKAITFFQRLLIALAGAASLPGCALAEELVDPVQLEQWADAWYGQMIAEKRSPGVTISVVQDGEVILAKGYGYSDYGRRLPVDPEKSAFLIGSISKTFIATAIAQLVDRAVIASLDDPANRYLRRIQLPGERGARVTIRHLLTHRAGFENILFGDSLPPGRTASIPLSSAEIQRFMPELVMEPGGPSVYSNWSFSMLGFLIEDVTGERLDDWLRKNIFLPLGMHHTSLMYDQRPANLTVNYAFDKEGAPVESAFNAYLPHPWIAAPGMVASTAGDMARYMNAHLFQGQDGGYPLVSEEMFQELHTERFRNAPIGAGFAVTFFTSRLNGAATIEHGGGTQAASSMMTMIPALRFGFFVSAMHGGPAPGTDPAPGAVGDMLAGSPVSPAELRESFVDRFLQRPSESVRGRPVDLQKLVGTYRATRRPFTTLAVLAELFDPAAVLSVSPTSDGRGLLLNGAGPYTQLGDGVFVSPTGENVWTDPYTIDHSLPTHIAFNLDAAGRPTNLVAGLGDQVWTPASPLFNPRTMAVAGVVFGLVAATGILLFAWPQRRRFANPTNPLGLCAALAAAAIPSAMMLGFASGDSLATPASLGDMTRFLVMVAAANAMIVLAALLAFRAVREWRVVGHSEIPSWARWGHRLHASAVAAACLGLLMVFFFFNLLGVRLPI
jgi:CubicO group peptidase (beta-lactamase class C family)